MKSIVFFLHKFRYPILCLVLVYFGIACFFYAFQGSLVFSPTKQIVSTPHELGLAYEAVTLHTRDGVELSAWFVGAENARSTVIVCHGNGGNISNRMALVRMFNGLSLNVLVFDYRGFGASSGKPSEKGTYRDAEAAWRYIVNDRGIPPDHIVVYGESLGGAVAAWLAEGHKPGALILQSCFNSIQKLAFGFYRFLPVRLISRFNYNTAEYVAGVSCPILIVHSRMDEVVPFSQGQELYALAKEPKEFLEIEGGHNDGLLISEEKFVGGVNLFLQKYVFGLSDREGLAGIGGKGFRGEANDSRRGRERGNPERP